MNTKCYRCGAETDYITMIFNEDDLSKSKIVPVCEGGCKYKENKTFALRCNNCGKEIELKNGFREKVYDVDDITLDTYCQLDEVDIDCGNCGNVIKGWED